MRWGGIFLLLFLVWHLLHFTIIKISPNPDATARRRQQPLRLVVASFQVPWMTLIYLLAMGALFLHLMHGVFERGPDPRVDRQPRGVPPGQARRLGHRGVIAGGFCIPPLAILFGLIK